MGRRSIDVTTTAEAGLLHASDEEHAAYALGQARVIFTQDQDFLRIHAGGIPHTGIAYCRQQSRSIGETIDGLVHLWEILEPEEMRGRVEFL
jgi:hypothetical protein